MPLVQQTIQTAIKGLITERQELVFPPDASVDEQNCTLKVDGTRERRRGIEFETAEGLSSFQIPFDQPVQEITWSNVGGISSLNFLVVQSGDTLYFYDKSVDPISAHQKNFSVSLTSFAVANGVSIPLNTFQGASLNGVFVVTHPACNPFYITYNVNTDTVTATLIIPRIRDFEWLGDTTVYPNGGAATPSRSYDSQNAGWTVALLNIYAGDVGNYPALTHPWYSGKDTNGNFSPEEWLKTWGGTTLISNGRFILDFFSKNREGYVTGAGQEIELSRFRTVEAYGGRFWYAGLESRKNGSRILFTKVIENESDYGFCYSQNDPTAEDISDLLDSDGGVINIPDCYGIKKLFAFGSSLLIFAENGIWVIKGVDEVFKATEFSVAKITGVGILTANSFVDVEGIPFWWSKSGIHSFARNDITTDPVEENITRTSIQTFWDEIDISKKLQVKAVYDNFNKIIYWIYPANNEISAYRYTKLLLLDVTLQAFIPWTISDAYPFSPYIVGASVFNSTGLYVSSEIVMSSGEAVTSNGELVLSIASTGFNPRDNAIKFLVKDTVSGRMTFAGFTNEDFLDWERATYSSYVELGYNFFNSLTTRKHPMIITTYFNLTETGFLPNGTGYDLINPSSCILKTYWDFKDSPSSTQQVYRLKRTPVVNINNLNSFNYGSNILINRTRIKGRGRVMNLRFESEGSKNFSFLGYEVIGYSNEGL